MKTRIPYTRPSITEVEISYATDAAKNGWGSNCYGYIEKFENAFKQHLNVPYAISTSSCTGSLHLGMASLGIGSGDEVIIADTNWIASVSPIVQLGAKPVFVDILDDTWCIDPGKVEAAITSRTKAIVAVHLYGNLCEMDILLSIGSKYGIPVIEDAAEAIGSVYKAKRAGSLGKFGAFSFHGTKTITTGEGGMFVTSDAVIYEKVLTLSNHGRARGQKKQFWSDCVGFKYKMSNIQAALGCAQMERIDSLVARKREILSLYRQGLSGVDGIRLNFERDGTVIGAWMPTIVFERETGVTREMLQSAFCKENIDARVFFWPLSGLPMFQPVTSNVNAWDIPKRAINLPSYHDISLEEIDRICKILKSITKQC